MRTSNSFGALALIVAAFALALGETRAQTSNYWRDVAGSYSGNFTNPAHWSRGTAPVPTDLVFFTNRQSTAYTVEFTGSTTSGPLRVFDDSVTYDLKGYRWTVSFAVGASIIGTNPAYAMTVKFLSSSPTNAANGNVVDFGTDPHQPHSMNNTRLVVDNSLGYPVRMIWALGNGAVNANCDVLVSGAGSEFALGYINGGTFNGNMLVTNGATFRVLNVYLAGTIGTWFTSPTVTVANASMFTPAMTVGGYIGGKGTVILRDGGAWSASGDVTLGVDGLGGGNQYFGNLVVTNGSFVGQSIIVGENNGNGPAPGRLVIQSGGSVTLSNTLWISMTNSAGRATYTANLTNIFILDNGTLLLGGAINGSLTNDGIMQVAGAIIGKGAAAGLVRNNGRMDVATNGIGALALSNLNFVASSNSLLFFEFNSVTNDQIAISGGTATIGGTATFTNLAGFSPYKTMNKRWDFVRADSIAYTATDNMSALMASFGLTASDYAFGVVDGGKILRLSILPKGTIFSFK